jgi:tetratricopeptide (TPR) repeat protein
MYRRSGRQKAAEPYYLHALELYEKHLGPEHTDVAAVLNNLGVFYTNEKRFDEAERAHQRALAIRRKANPKANPDLAQSKCNLAVLYHLRGDFDQAGELYRESLRAWEEIGRPAEDYDIVASNYDELLR